MATYEYRHKFIGNAIDEYARTFIVDPPWILSVSESKASMDIFMTAKERDDWFAMYCMGGVPWPGQGGFAQSADSRGLSKAQIVEEARLFPKSVVQQCRMLRIVK